jgi:galactokinase
VTSWTSRAPGRVNLIGEHTDYNDGLVLPVAIEQGVTATVRPRGDDRIVVTSAQVPGAEVAVRLADLVPGAVTGWAAYALGAVWALVDDAGAPHGLDIHLDGDVPLGAGLSSSAAVECAVIVALEAAWDVTLSPREAARRAQRAENDFVGVPSGAMDQVASMMGEVDRAVFFDVGEDVVRLIPLELGDATLLIVDTRASHALVDGEYASRRADCECASRLLGVGSLREIDDPARALTLLEDDDLLLRRVRHVTGENQRVLGAVECLKSGDTVELGRLLTQSHVSLRDDYEVSCPELDCAVSASLAAGALGARMMGGGFGGSAICLVPAALADTVAQEVSRAFRDRAFLSPHVLPVRSAPGARLLPTR